MANNMTNYLRKEEEIDGECSKLTKKQNNKDNACIGNKRIDNDRCQWK